jgi:hypothetical protein
MKYFFAFLLPIIFIACTNPTGIKNIAVGADSVAINYFKGNGSMDTVINMIMLKDKNEMNKLADYIEAGTTQNYKCGYDGSLHFFKRDVVIQDIDFRMNDVQCMHFSFMLAGKLFSTTLSPEAKQFLETVNKK